MDLYKAFPTISKMRFSIVHLLVLTTGVAFFFVVLMNENEWLVASYTTLICGVVLSQLVTAICGDVPLIVKTVDGLTEKKYLILFV